MKNVVFTEAYFFLREDCEYCRNAAEIPIFLFEEIFGKMNMNNFSHGNFSLLLAKIAGQTCTKCV